MGKSPRMQPRAAIDVATVRETLAYMADDLARAPRFRAAAAHLGLAIAELDAVAPSADGRGSDGLQWLCRSRGPEIPRDGTITLSPSREEGERW